MATQAENIADLIALGLRELGRNKWTNAGTTIQKYHAFKRLFKKKKVQIGDGHGIQWNVKHRVSGAARNVDMNTEDEVSIPDVMVQANIPWRHTTTNYGLDRREVRMNGGASRIVDIIKVRRTDALESLAGRIETDFWATPPSSSDALTPYGVQYYSVANTTAGKGFNGGNPPGFTAGAANLDSATYTRWANYSDTFAQVTKDDLISAMREAATLTEWEPPIDFPDYKIGEDMGIYLTKYFMLAKMERLCENQNDRLGSDLASQDGRVLFRRIPVAWVPQLQASALVAAFGIHWGYMYPVCLRGEYMNETVVPVAAKQHTKSEVHTDITWNMVCKDRRSQWRIDQGTAHVNDS